MGGEHDHPGDESPLVRGWRRADIQRLISECTEAQCWVLIEIASNPGITTPEIAANLDWEGSDKVKGFLSALARRTNAFGINDPVTGGLSWPIELDETERLQKMLMPEAAAAVVFEAAGFSRG